MAGDLIQTPQTRWIQGNYESVRRGTLIVLHARVTTVAGNDRWTTFREQFTTAGYAVPAGKSLYVTDLYFLSNVAGIFHQLLYGDNDKGISSAVAPTNPVYYDGNPLGGAAAWAALAANTNYHFPIHARFPAAKYPALTTSGATTVYFATLIGHEE